jgi:hypothetical protein
LAFHTNNNSSPSLHLLVARFPWPYFQWANALILSWTDAWFSTNFRGNTLIFLWPRILFISNHDFGHPFVEYSTCLSSQDICL